VGDVTASGERVGAERSWPSRERGRDRSALALLYLEPISSAIGVAAFVAAEVVHLVLARTGAAASMGARAG
jgi:hypothetical protein